MDCADNKDGTATVEYTPTEEGDYAISVKFADEDIPGSPFMVREAYKKELFAIILYHGACFYVLSLHDVIYAQ